MKAIDTPRWTGQVGLLMGLFLVALALLARSLLDPILENLFPYSLFVAATVLTAWLGGWRNALIIHALGFFVANWFFIPPRYGFALTFSTVWGTAIYSFIGAAICLFTARWQSSARRVQREMEERERAQEKLLAQEREMAAYAAELEKRVALRTQELRDALTRLQTFTYSMVHDMRAPLRAISGFASVLEEEFAPTPQARDYLHRLSEASHRLDDLIAALQSYGETSSRDVAIEALKLDDLVNDLIDQYPDLHAAREYITIHRPLPMVCANSALLTQALAHLLSNALKFVPPFRTPEVHLSAERRERTIRLWVKDNGVGIPAEYHEKIFGMFEQLAPPGQGAGTGMGLAVARRAVERMHGAIGVESKLGEGSRFWIDLPAATLLFPPCPPAPGDRLRSFPPAAVHPTGPEFRPID